jgi:hypothetical protein
MWRAWQSWAENGDGDSAVTRCEPACRHSAAAEANRGRREEANEGPRRLTPVEGEGQAGIIRSNEVKILFYSRQVAAAECGMMRYDDEGTECARKV